MTGWERSMYFDDTGLPWVPTSPNMPTLNTAIVYPGGCLIEATELSEGRGTTMPFEWIGAPYIDAPKLCQHLNTLKFKGVKFRPIAFKPGFQKHAGTECFGFRIHVTDRSLYSSYLVGLEIIKALQNLYPNDFKWRKKPYEFVTDIPAIDLLTGNDLFRKSGGTEMDLTNNFRDKRKGYLTY